MATEFYIGVVGSRRRNSQEDREIVSKAITANIEALKEINELHGQNLIPVLVSGGCRVYDPKKGKRVPCGADGFAEEYAEEQGIPIIIYYPDRSKLDSKLPPKIAHAKINYARNAQIADKSDVLIACVAPDRKGGTENTIEKFLKRTKNEELLTLV